MSADNWAVCPNCVNNAEAKLHKQHEQALAARDAKYGVVALDQFGKFQAEVDATGALLSDFLTGSKEEFRTFREDYEFWGAEEGEVQVSYRGGCSACGAHLDFSHSHRIPVVTR